MVTIAEPRGGSADGRVLHDRLENAYFSLARTSARWFGESTPRAVFGGFDGLDSSTMNRVALLDAPDEEGAEAVLDRAADFFGSRGLPWSVQLTPHSRPPEAAALLSRRGMTPVSALTVMTWSRLADVPPARSGAEVREAEPEEIGRFTEFTIDAFRMPTRYLTPLTDVNRAWVAAGAKAYFATHRGKPIGTALLTRYDGVAGVYNVATHRAHRRRGVATALMRHLLMDFTSVDEDVLTLQVASGSVAEGFYARLGFVPRYSWALHTAYP